MIKSGLNSMPLLLSVFLHLALLGFAIFGWQGSAEIHKPKPVVIQAKIVDLSEKTKQKKNLTAEKKPKTQPKPSSKQNEKKQKDLLKKKAFEEKKKRLLKEQAEKKLQAAREAEEKAKALLLKKQAEKAQKLKEKKAQERQLELDKQRALDQAKKRKLEKERQEQEKLRRQEQKRQEEARLLEQQRQQEEQAKAQRIRELEMLSQAMAEEEAHQRAQQQAMENQREAASHAGLIRKKISRYWNRPLNTRNGMVVELRLTLIPTGDVVAVEIVKGSGDEAFDRSAVNAVKKAGQFSSLTQVSSDVFETYFRNFNLKFNPEDLDR